jgi:hypothetical protein
MLRLSYNDSANTFQIVDDQFVPSLSTEEQITPKSNTTEIPLLGKFSIAKSLEIKSEVSSRLSNMLAISANSNYENKATLSTNGDSFGFINTSYSDRYIVNRGEITGSNQNKKNNDSLKISAAQFNSTISDFYSKINPSQTSVSHATNYYIEKMTLVKNDEYATRASSMIPISVNFSTDGISGLGMGQSFTISDQLLPYTYTTRKIPNAPEDHINNVGFVMVGLTHTIENNQWNTAVRANMIYLKDKTEFSGSVIKTNFSTGVFGINSSRVSQDTLYPTTSGTCNDPYTDKNLNKGWTGKKQAFQRTVIDPSVEGPKLKAIYGDVLTKAILATIKIEQNFRGFNYNFGGFDITSGGWEFNPQLHNGYVVAKEGGTNLCKAFVSFINFESFIAQIVSSFKRKGFESAIDANSYAKIWYEKWNGFGVRTKYPDRPTSEVDAEALRDAASIWNSINV